MTDRRKAEFKIQLNMENIVADEHPASLHSAIEKQEFTLYEQAKSWISNKVDKLEDKADKIFLSQ